MGITFSCPRCKWSGGKPGFKTVQYGEDDFDNEPCCPKCAFTELDINGSPEPIGEINAT
jgi:hypothetical protein